ncbi:MAG: hypothetical protein IJO48_05075 [Clostridia bacterium]|nr:hypothetical protein [Clostridia bacterium]
MNTITEKGITFYPLTESQATMFLNLKWSFGHEEIVNICATMHFESEIDPNLLLQATYLAILRNKSASIRCRKVGKEVMQYFSNKAPEQIIVMDYSDSTEEKLNEDILKFSSTPFPNHSMDTQLYSIRLIKKPDGLYGLYFCVNHIIFDAYSLIMQANEILTMYECLRDGKPIPENKCDPIGCLENDLNYIDSEKFKADCKFWEDEFYATEPTYCDICGEPPVKGKKYGPTLKLGRVKAGAKQYRLPKEIVDKANALALENSVSPLSVFYLALRSYISKVNNYREDIVLQTNIARRGTLLEKRAFGVRVNGAKVRVNLPNTTKFKESLSETSISLMRTMAHANLSTTRVVDIYEKKFSVPPMNGYDVVNFTYNPVFINEHEGLPIHFSLHPNGSFAMKMYLTIMPLDASGDLVFNYDYQFATTKPDTVDKLHEHIVKALNAMIKNPEITLGELAKL